MRFGIAEAAVEFEDARAVGREHDPGIQRTDERSPFGAEAVHSGLQDRTSEFFDHRGRADWGGGVRTHAAGVRPAVAVEQPFVILCGRHGFHVDAVGEGQQRYFFPAQPFLNHHFIARRSKFAVEHDRAQRLLCIVSAVGDDDAFARREARGLDYDRVIYGKQVSSSLVEISESGEAGSGDVVPRHKCFGERFGRFNLRRRLRWAEDFDSGGAQIVCQPGGQRRFGADEGEVNVLLAGEGDDGRVIGNW